MRPIFTSSTLRLWLLSVLGCGGSLATWAQTPVVTSVQPVRHAAAAPRTGPVTVNFSQSITAASAPNLKVYGSQLRGKRPGTVSGGGTTSLSFQPAQPFAPGERVSVSVPNTLTSASGAGAARQVYQFTAATGGTGRGFFLDTLGIGGTTTRDQVLGDIDNDGDLDLLTPIGLYGMYSYLNDGTGHFTPGANVVMARMPSGAVLADFNQDGFLDLAAGDADNATVSVALNDGSGVFGVMAMADQTLGVGGRVSSVAAGDVDGDGDLDFVSANYSANSVSIGFNSGPGFFVGVTSYSMGTQPSTVQLADVDNDGDLDLLSSNRGSNTVSVRLNTGAGTFGAATSVSVGAAPSDLALVDLDADGDLDLLTTNADAGTVSVRLNNGLGSFAGTTTLTLPTGSAPTALSLGDVDADGDPDVVVAQGPGGQVFTFLNAGGTLTLQYSPLELSDPLGRLPASMGVALADLDGDLDLDLVTANATEGRVVLARNGGAPPAVVPVLNAFSPGAGPVGTSIRITGNALGSTTTVRFNGTAASFVVNSNVQLTATVPVGASTGPVAVTTAGGTATSSQTFVVTAGPVPPVAVTGTVPAPNTVVASATAAVEASFASPIAALSVRELRVVGSQRRGRQLGAVSGGGTSTLSLAPNPAFAPGERVQLVLPASLTGTSGGAVQGQVTDFRVAVGGTGQGVFSPGSGTPLALPQYATELQPVDLDNDGDLDLVGLGRTSAAAYPSAVLVLLNNGQGTFTSSTAAVPTVAAEAFVMTTLDADGDGDLDVVVAEKPSTSSSLGRLTTWFNNGQGRFAAGPQLSNLDWPRGLLAGDMDADGDLDLVMRENADKVRVLLNNGSGAFSPGSTATFNNIYQLRLADLDADGDLDVGVMTYSSVSSALNNGAALLTRQPDQGMITGSRIAQDMELGDLNGDGFPDMVVCADNFAAGASAGLLTVWLGRGNGQFVPPVVDLGITAEPSSIALADVNADGRLDLLSFGNAAAGLTVEAHLGDGRGRFGLAASYPLAGTGQVIFAPAVADFDADGDLDVAAGIGGANTLVVSFNQGRAAATISTLVPAQGPVGTWVSIGGTNLTSTSRVTFGGVTATEWRVLSATEVAAVVPAGATTGPVMLTTPAGAASSPGAFTVLTPVAVSSLLPARNAPSAPRASNVSVTYVQSLPASANAAPVAHGGTRGRHLGSTSGSGSATHTLDPAQDFAAGERVQVTLPGGGGALPEVYHFTAATDGPGRGNLLWNSYLNKPDYELGEPGDFDADGFPDLVFFELFANKIYVEFNDGQGRFGVRPRQELAASGIRTVRPVELNGDGHLDLLAVQYYASSNNRYLHRVVWWPGTGNGTFGPMNAMFSFNSAGGRTGGNSTSEAVLGDLNGDGTQDLAVLMRGVDSVLVALNQGNGAFQRQADLAVAPNASTIELADLDGNGTLDLLSGGRNTLYRAMGSGDGRFVPAAPMYFAGSIISFAPGDVDGDGKLDLLVGMESASSVGATYLYRGTGQGGFAPAQQLAGAAQAGYLHLLDFDSDGDLDIATAVTYHSLGIQLLRNDGTGQFSAAASLAPNTLPWNVAIADFNGDGSLDFSLASDSTISSTNFQRKEGLFVYLNRPAAPTISSFTPTSGGAGTVVTLTGTSLGGVTSVRVGGVPTPFTLVSATQLTLTIGADAVSGPITVVAPNGTATSAASFQVPAPLIAGFTPGSGAVQRLVLLTGSYLGGATAVSFNGTAAPGFRVVSGTQLTVLVPPGATTGPVRVTTPSGTAVSSTAFVVAAVATGLSPNRNAQHVARAANVTIATPLPIGQMAAEQVRVFGSRARGQYATTVSGAATGQLVLDPAQDFAPGELLSVSIPDAVQGLQNGVGSRQVYQFRAAAGGTGRGTLGGSLNVLVGGTPNKVQLGDVDNDGDLDIVVGNPSGLNVLKNNGTAAFTASPNSPGIYSPDDLRLADVDGDGDLDLLVAQRAADLILVRLNNGTGSFAGGQDLNFVPTKLLAVGDIDGDGDLDFVSANSTTVTPYLNSGSGTFQRQNSLSNVPANGSLQLGDVDGDGDLDLLLTGDGTSNGDELTVRLNSGSGTFTGTYALTLTGRYATKTVLGDMDNDGDLDVAVADYGYNPDNTGLTILRNNGAGQFTPGPRFINSVHLTPADLELGDVDADGDLDLVLTGSGWQGNILRDAYLFLNDGAAGLTRVAATTLAGQSTGLALGDLDGDGDLDLAAPSNFTASVAVRLNDAAVPLAAQSAQAALVRLYPNPASQHTTLEVPPQLLAQAGQVELLNALGQVVRTQPLAPGAARVSLDLRRLTAGVYTVRLTTGAAEPITRRLVVK